MNDPSQLPANLVKPSEDAGIGELLSVLLFRRRLLLASFLLVFVVGALLVMQLEPRYQSVSKVMIGIPESKVVDVESVLAGDLSGDSEIRGEEEVLKSRGIAEKVVERFRLVEHPEFNPALAPPSLLASFSPENLIPAEYHAALGLERPQFSAEEQAERTRNLVVDNFLRQLEVGSVNRSNVIRVQFESRDPRLAARIANEIPEIYIDSQMEAKFEATERATRWLDEQLGELKDRVEASERAVQEYKVLHGITEGTKNDLVQEQMSAINVELAQAKAKRAEAEARLRQVQRLLGGDNLELESSAEVLNSVLIQRLREQEVEVLRKQSELSVEYGLRHPKMIQVRQELGDLRSKIASEVRKIAAALESDLQVALSRESSLKGSLAALEKESGVTQAARVKLRSLESEASSNQALFSNFLDRFKETSSTQNIQQADARVISRAVVPVTPSFPNRKLLLSLVAVLALGTGVVVVFLIESLSSGIFTPEQVESELGLPVIGIIPMGGGKTPHTLVRDKPHSSYAEAFNTLRTSILLSEPDHELRLIGVTSSLPEEGKSTLVLSLASNIAQSGKRVLIVDTDVRRAVIDKKLRLDSSKGLTDFLAEDANNLSDYITKHEATGVYVMPKGSAEFINATDLLSSRRMARAVKALRQNFDLVIFDTPPVMAVTDARIVSGLVDKMIFVVRWSKTPKKVVAGALDQLRKARADVAGVVLQQTDLKKQRSYYYGAKYSGYYYHYGKYGQYYKS